MEGVAAVGDALFCSQIPSQLEDLPVDDPPSYILFQSA